MVVLWREAVSYERGTPVVTLRWELHLLATPMRREEVRTILEMRRCGPFWRLSCYPHDFRGGSYRGASLIRNTHPHTIATGPQA